MTFVAYTRRMAVATTMTLSLAGYPLEAIAACSERQSSARYEDVAISLCGYARELRLKNGDLFRTFVNSCVDRVTDKSIRNFEYDLGAMDFNGPIFDICNATSPDDIANAYSECRSYCFIIPGIDGN